ncbi:hypothetical protein COCC4DRAFT_21661 [Bipolaris maydis ATCC 48331]|uniref:Uncharacterized protein n=1 Tax=Cochliobolus heterostrophus (strain C4 / ATCC 48331 / race T) TaxID=665024 RepID=N4XEE2_COCH4|nr:uncharacterized protein COCC4DRAFT_21661 [Bipolaris maydis ATCC 48331]ENI06903.1 hypothetical protein COCC4DRAFT_21661 [Bipolaris maydis ATCC 48331]
MVDGVEDRVRRHVKRGYGAVKRYAKGHATEAVLVRRRVSARRSSISSVLDPDKTDVFGLGVLHVSTGERGKERSASEAVWLRGRGLWERLMDMPYSPLLIDTAVDGSQVIVAATFWGSMTTLPKPLPLLRFHVVGKRPVAKPCPTWGIQVNGGGCSWTNTTDANHDTAGHSMMHLVYNESILGCSNDGRRPWGRANDSSRSTTNGPSHSHTGKGSPTRVPLLCRVHVGCRLEKQAKCNQASGMAGPSLSQPLLESTSSLLYVEYTRMPSARRHGTLACPLGLAEDLGQRKCTLRESGCVSGNFIWACASDRCDGYPADGTLQLAYMIHESNHPHFDTASPVILQIPPRSCIPCLQIPAAADLLPSRPGRGNMPNAADTPNTPVIAPHKQHTEACQPQSLSYLFT